MKTTYEEYETRSSLSFHSSAQLKLAVSIVSAARNVAPRELLSPARGSEACAHARQMALYLTHVGLCVSMKRLALLCGRHRSTVAHACFVTEDRRDAALFDLLMNRLEAALVTMARASGLAGEWQA